uniref:Uncharacterized protein n=1 Tax=Globodera rostochiensis TaxID=31243 RepID=A0A914I511_GLORO
MATKTVIICHRRAYYQKEVSVQGIHCSIPAALLEAASFTSARQLRALVQTQPPNPSLCGQAGKAVIKGPGRFTLRQGETHEETERNREGEQMRERRAVKETENADSK